jgi:hypothetical protein
MYCVAIRIASAGFLLYALFAACPLPAAQSPDASDADSKGAPSEQLPPPQGLPSQTIAPNESCCFHTPTRINRYAIWQLYAVDRNGQFRPRVLYTAYGSFYLYDGRPFPWISNHQLDFALQVVFP